METSYANLAWFGSPQGGVDIPALHRTALAALASATDDRSAFGALQAFVKGFGDGHFSLRQVDAGVKSTETIAEPPAPSRDEDPSVACESLGFTRDDPTRFTSLYEALPGFRLLSDGVGEAYRTGVVRAANGVLLGIVRLQQFDPYDFPSECAEAWRHLDRGPSAPERCDDECAGDIEVEVNRLLLAHLRDRLVAMDQAGAQAVIVDLADVPGGSDIADWEPRLFTRAPVFSARLGLVGAPASARYYDEQIGDLRAAAKEPLDASDRAAVVAAIATYEANEKRLAAKPQCAMRWVWSEQRPWTPFDTGSACSNLLFDGTYASGAKAWLAPGAIASTDAARAVYWPSIAWPYMGTWTKPVYVVIDRKTYSAAEMTAAVFSDNHVATLVGEKTGGDGCGFMYENNFTLPKSGVRVRIPNCVRLRRDGTDEVAGIAPDIAVPAYQNEDSGQRATRLVETISKDYQQHATSPVPAK